MSAAAPVVQTRRRNPFRAGTVLAVLAIGTAAFLLMLYAIGQGWTGNNERNGGEHAGSTAIPGFKGLHDLLDNQGYDVQLSRSEAGYDEYGLLVLTPPQFSSPDQIADLLEQRLESGMGPTLLILPKWSAFAVPPQLQEQTGAQDGWVFLGDASPASWFDELPFAEGAELVVGRTGGWSGMERRGSLPAPEQVQALQSQPGEAKLTPLVTDREGDMLVGAFGDPSSLFDTGYGYYDGQYPFIVVFEPDLMNNYGMEDRARAELAMAIIDSAMVGDPAMPVLFDMTLPGLGSSENLLTLAFSPPFLAATLCLLFAALVIAWRGFNRFGAPVAEAPTRAQGKRELARNGAALVARVKRFHLLADPYAALMGKRIAAQLGIKDTHPEARAKAIDRALSRRGLEPAFTARTNELRNAGNPKDIIRAASALKDIERMLKR